MAFQASKKVYWVDSHFKVQEIEVQNIKQQEILCNFGAWCSLLAGMVSVVCVFTQKQPDVSAPPSLVPGTTRFLMLFLDASRHLNLLMPNRQHTLHKGIGFCRSSLFWVMGGASKTSFLWHAVYVRHSEWPDPSNSRLANLTASTARRPWVDTNKIPCSLLRNKILECLRFNTLRH